MSSEKRIEKLKASAIRLDGGTQARVKIDTDAVRDYAEALAAGEDLGRPVVYFDGCDHWAADGFHRILAHRSLEWEDVECDVVTGSKADAQWAAAGANKSHGVRRTNADKLRAVEMALAARPEWSGRRIADHVGVSHEMVNKYVRDKEKKAAADSASDAPAAGEAPKRDRGPKKDGAAESASAAPAAETPKPAADQGPPRDKFGIPIGEHAAEAFAGSALFDRLLASLRQCAADLSALVDSPAGGHLMKSAQWVRSASKAGGRWVLSHLDNAVATVEAAKPYLSDCPYAHNPEKPHDKNCPLCRGLGWTASIKGHQIPPSLMDAMKRHHGVETGEE